MKTILALLIVIFISLGTFIPVAAQIHMVPYIDNTGRDVCLVWDSDTGKSVYYAWKNSIRNWKAYTINLPENPVPDSDNPIMMHPYIDNTGRDVCLTWDVMTGRSVFYAWSNDIDNWKPYSINLPEEPIPGVRGPFMMMPYIDNTGRDVCLVWEGRTGQSLFYAWSNDASNWKQYEINLPKTPVANPAGPVMLAPYIDNTGRDVTLGWDVESGTSIFYSWSNSKRNWKPYEINLPENPVPDALGDILLRPYIDNTGRDVCLAWDFQSGTSVFYAWNNDISNWKAYDINLPKNPIPGVSSGIMMWPYIDNTGRDVCLVWNISTGRSIYYSWSNEISNWKAFEINLPENPLKLSEEAAD